MRLQTSIAVLLFASATAANAATLYVAPSGNDSNNGSISAPFRTITKAAGMARPGDTVSVRGGVYNEIVKASVRGTASARITIQSHPGEKAIVDGTGTPLNTDLVQLGSAEYLDFTGFEVRNSTRIGIAGWGSKNLRILNNVVHRSHRGGIYVGHSSFGSTYDITIDGNTVYNNVRENELHNMNGGWAQSVSVQNTDRATITRNRVYENDGEGIVLVLSRNGLVQGNEVSDSFSVGIYLDNAQHSTVNGNLVYSTGNSRYFRSGHPAAGISMANERYTWSNPLTDNRITNNIVVNSRWGIHYGAYEAGGGLKNTLISNNTVFKATSAMVSVDQDAHSGTTIQNNIFFQSGGGVMHAGTTSGLTFRHNNWFGGSAGAASGPGDVLINPLLANPGGTRADDYRLGNLSPAIHTGHSAYEVTHDFWGSSRSTAYDIGAHEQSVALGSSSPSRPALEPPASVTALPLNAAAVQLRWSAADSAAAYRVYRDRALLATVTTTEWIDREVEASRTYSYVITSIDGIGGESAPSTTVTARTLVTLDMNPPTMPQNFVATAAGPAEITLRWSPSSDDRGVIGYFIFRDGQLVATVTGTEWTDSGLKSNTTYTYEVSAFDAARNLSARATATATTPHASTRGRAIGRG